MNTLILHDLKKIAHSMRAIQKDSGKLADACDKLYLDLIAVTNKQEVHNARHNSVVPNKLGGNIGPGITTSACSRKHS